MKKFAFILAAIILSACASKTHNMMTGEQVEAKKTEREIWDKYQYYSKIKNSYEPKWIASMNASKELSRTKKPKRNSVSKVSFDVAADGAIKNIKLMQPSLVPQADKLAMHVIQNTKRLPKPPAQILENGKTQLEWEFILQK